MEQQQNNIYDITISLNVKVFSTKGEIISVLFESNDIKHSAILFNKLKAICRLYIMETKYYGDK